MIIPRWLSQNSYQGLLLLFLDILSVYICIGISHQIRLGYWLNDANWQLVAITLITVVFLYIMNVYALDYRTTGVKVVVRTFAGVALSTLVVVALIYMSEIESRQDTKIL